MTSSDGFDCDDEDVGSVNADTTTPYLRPKHHATRGISFANTRNPSNDSTTSLTFVRQRKCSPRRPSQSRTAQSAPRASPTLPKGIVAMSSASRSLAHKRAHAHLFQ